MAKARANISLVGEIYVVVDFPCVVASRLLETLLPA